MCVCVCELSQCSVRVCVCVYGVAWAWVTANAPATQDRYTYSTTNKVDAGRRKKKHITFHCNHSDKLLLYTNTKKKHESAGFGFISKATQTQPLWASTMRRRRPKFEEDFMPDEIIIKMCSCCWTLLWIWIH